MIEFSCHTWSFTDLTLTEALGTIARLGFRYADLGSGIHFNPVKAVADPRRVAADIVADLRVYNLKLADVFLLLPRISDPDEAVRRYEIDQFKALLPVMRGIGAPGVTLSPGVSQPDTDPDETRQHIIDALTEMSDAAGDDLSISIEPHVDTVIQTPDEALALVEAVPGLSLTLDWAHFFYRGVRIREMTPLLPQTRHVHIRQASRDKLQTPAEGKDAAIDLPAVLRALQNAQYHGVICVEYLPTPQAAHGMLPVNVIRETVKLRDALRAARK